MRPIESPRLTERFDLPTCAAATITLVLWASAVPAIRAALVGYSPPHLLVIRLLVASTAMLICAPMAKVRVPRACDVPALALLAVIGITGYNLALNHGETRIPAGAASFLVNTVPIFTGRFFFGERLPAVDGLG